jgi:hypothetical protein
MSHGSNSDSTGASEELMICQKQSFGLLSCCGYPLCGGCFDTIKKLCGDDTKPPICPNCQKLIMALFPIIPILKSDGDATRASDEEVKRLRAERVAKARAEI